MTVKKDQFSNRDASTSAVHGAVPVSIGGGLYVPSRYVLELEVPERMHVRAVVHVTPDGIPECRQLAIQPLDGSAVTRETLESFHLTELLSIGQECASFPLGFVGKDLVSEQGANYGVVRGGGYAGHRGMPVLRRLERVAEVYREAKKEGRSTTKAVAADLGISESYAGKLVWQARDRGVLEPRTREEK